jgi:hypothetical protein
MIVVIGSQWLDQIDSGGNRRLDDSGDFVRVEIESAFKRGVLVIPVLVQGTHMPSAKDLPASLKDLAYRNSIPVRPDPDFHRDMNRLITNLEEYVQE